MLIRHSDVLLVARERGGGWSLAGYRAGQLGHPQGFT